MLRLLMGDEDFEIVEVALAVVTPWPSEDFLNVGVSSLLTHLGRLEMLSGHVCRMLVLLTCATNCVSEIGVVWCFASSVRLRLRAG